MAEGNEPQEHLDKFKKSRPRLFLCLLRKN